MQSNLEEYECVRYWLTQVSKNTRAAYTHWLGRFCEFLNLNPDTLLEATNQDRRRVHMRVKDFYVQLQSEGYASGSRFAAYTAIRSFFSHNDCFLGRMPKYFRGVTQFASHRVMGSEEVFAMLVVASSFRDKAAISFLAQTGQRSGILRALRYGHVRASLDKGANPVIIDVKGELLDGKGSNVNKSRTAYSFALGRECAGFLRKMIETRKEFGEPMNDDSWLFRSLGSGAVFENGRWRPRGQAPSSAVGLPMCEETLRHSVVRAATIAGVQSKQEFYTKREGKACLYEIHPHAFRRWWKARMRLGGVSDIGLLDYMMGHSTIAFPYRGAYDSYDTEYVRREYLKAESFLSVMPTTKTERDHPAPTQRVVIETELGPLLAQGWRFVTTLPSGRVVLEHPSIVPALTA